MAENYIDASGIHIATYEETKTQMVEGTADVPGLKQIYGADINVEQNSPDGQFLNIFILSVLDLLGLIVEDYNSKDPDQAVGVALDSVSQLCGIQRNGGIYTLTAVDITTDRTLNLDGLDNPDAIPFTVADSTGNQFQLIESASLSNGINTLNFQAVKIGNVQILQNTLTTAVTVIPGIVSVNNPDSPYQQGVNQETDAQFRLRRQRSTSLPAQGFLQSLYGGLLTLTGVEEVKIYENDTNTVDSNDVPAHTIWVIVDGGTDDDIANMIYLYRNAGCGMKGGEVVDITQIDSSIFPIYFDRADDQDLYIRFSVEVVGGGSYDADYLKTQLALLYLLGIYEESDVTSIQAIIKQINPDLVITDLEVSGNDSDWESDLVYPDTKKSKFVLETANIDIL